MTLRSYIIAVFLFLLASCSGDVAREQKQDTGKIKEHLVNANRIFVENEAEQIEAYQQRHQLKLQLSGTGLRYKIITNGKNLPRPLAGDTVSLNYSVFLLDGTPCYDSQDSPVEFIVGKAEMPNGMDEALQMMHEGDSCILILPSHLAYGFTGDGDKIPGNAATLYYISLRKIIKQ